MNFKQYFEHLEQKMKREYDNSGPINFERLHFPGRLGYIEFRELTILRQTTPRLAEDEDFADRKVQKRRSLFSGWLS